jgi:hypothetical protein
MASPTDQYKKQMGEWENLDAIVAGGQASLAINCPPRILASRTRQAPGWSGGAGQNYRFLVVTRPPDFLAKVAR